MEIFLFYSFCILTIVSALATILLPNLLHALLSFIITLLGVAVMFLFAGAEFLAVSQIMIYAGGILILITFGLMLTTKIGSKQSNPNNTNYWFTVFTGTGLFVFFGYKITQLNIFGDPVHTRHPLKKIGFHLLTDHLFTFEVITILLIISLIGAAVISKGITNHDK